MTGFSYAAQRRIIEASLRDAFTGGATWPLDPGSLAALVDLGYSDRHIAGWFSVGPDDVCMLRSKYGLGAAELRN